MEEALTREYLERLRTEYPDKFLPEDEVFSNIHRGDRIFISTACGEPQYLVRSLIEFVDSHPKAFFDAEVLHVWTLGVAPYTDPKFKHNFRHNSFFISDSRSRRSSGAGSCPSTSRSFRSRGRTSTDT
jgi:acyl-CoA hydrolase